jgi:hypothetical protein
MTQTQTTDKPELTPADTYPAAFIALHAAVHGKIDVPKVVRLGDLCAGLAVRRFEQFVTERDALFAELFGGRSPRIQEIARQYMFEAGRFGQWNHRP